jgi:HAD superfamily hydrolase (TIGR01509 family)
MSIATHRVILMKNGVISDIDGTLIDSNDAHAASWKEVLDEEGLRSSFEEIRRSIGMGDDKLLPKLAGVEKDTIRGRKISGRRREIFRTKYLPHLKPFPKTRELLLKMRSQGLKLAVATSSTKGDLDDLLRLIPAEDLFDVKVSAEDVEHSKPEPEVFEAALNLCGLESDEALVLGDTPYDIEAAYSLNIQAVALRCGGWSDQDLKGAIAIYDDPKDLLENFESSPFYRATMGFARKVGRTPGLAEGSLETVEEALSKQSEMTPPSKKVA